MSHDFAVCAADEEGLPVYAFFFGYAEGFLYRAFGAAAHDMGVSGDGARLDMTEDDMRRGLERASTAWRTLRYPDPRRFDKIAEFKKRFDAGELQGPFWVEFS